MGVGLFSKLLKSGIYKNIYKILLIKFNILHAFCKNLNGNNKSFSGVRASFHRASSKQKKEKIIPDVNNGIMGNSKNW